jgi:hypothetical protein
VLKQHANKGRNAKQVVLKQHANKGRNAKWTDANGLIDMIFYFFFSTQTG